MDCALCLTEGAINTSLAPAKIQLPFPDTFLVALLLLFYPAPPHPPCIPVLLQTPFLQP